MMCNYFQYYSDRKVTQGNETEDILTSIYHNVQKKQT